LMVSKRFSLSQSKHLVVGLTLVEVVIVALVLIVLFGVLVPKAIQYRRDYTDSMKATLVYDAIHKAGTWRTIGSGPMGNSSVLVFLNGRLDGGIGVILSNNDASFWTKDDVIYVVNDAARALLPAAPQAPPQITHAAIRAVAK